MVVVAALVLAAVPTRAYRDLGIWPDVLVWVDDERLGLLRMLGDVTGGTAVITKYQVGLGPRAPPRGNDALPHPPAAEARYVIYYVHGQYLCFNAAEAAFRGATDRCGLAVVDRQHKRLVARIPAAPLARAGEIRSIRGEPTGAYLTFLTPCGLLQLSDEKSELHYRLGLKDLADKPISELACKQSWKDLLKSTDPMDVEITERWFR